MQGKRSRSVSTVALIAILYWKCSLSRGQQLTSSEGYAPDQQGLIYIKRSVPNFVQFQQRVPCYGWSTSPSKPVDICQWNGVGCNAAMQVTSLVFPSNASELIGNIADVLYGASLIPNLQQLFLANQSFVGTLPQGNLAMPALEELDISNNHIEAWHPSSSPS
ncbi:g4307 [Coccomyxa elongata]